METGLLLYALAMTIAFLIGIIEVAVLIKQFKKEIKLLQRENKDLLEDIDLILYDEKVEELQRDLKVYKFMCEEYEEKLSKTKKKK